MADLPPEAQAFGSVWKNGAPAKEVSLDWFVAWGRGSVGERDGERELRLGKGLGRPERSLGEERRGL